ncbi:MAG TPA: hypothetical protein PKN52_09420 [Trueperaceae bacterium]|nr:hypothetical protein [Trueperaceae bacterium]
MKAVRSSGPPTEPREFPDFPGLYRSGVSLPLSELGLSEEEAAARLPDGLEIVDLPGLESAAAGRQEPGRSKDARVKGGED